MRIAAVIAEYNPFHNGHALHLQKTREAGADAVAAIMSGNFVQRGEPAVCSKWARAEAAVRCGADLVAELPVYWAAARAQRFASGAVSIADRLGCADMLSFGSECGDTARILRAAEAVGRTDVPKTLLDAGMSFAAAREAAVRESDASAAELLRTPNDTLAIEYALAAARRNASFDLLAVPRDCAHDGDPVGKTASASYIRQRLSDETVLSFCPPDSADILRREIAAGHAPADARMLERMLLTKLRLASPADVAALPDVSEGLENRILSAAKQADSLASLLAAVKSKRYPLARIRRILLSFLLDIRECDVPPEVPYLRILAIGKRGEEILRRVKANGSIPILTKRTNVSALGADAERVFRAEYAAAEMYAATLPRMGAGGSEWTTPIYKQSY